MSDIKKIVERYVKDMSKAGMDFEGTSTKEDGTPVISFYLHTQECAARRKKPCDCRTDEK